MKEGTPLPQPGDVITIHHKDGSSSERTITAVHEPDYDKSLHLAVLCGVT